MPSLTPARRGVSPVIGVALMLVVVVLLAAIVGLMVTGFGDTLREPRPHVAFDVAYHPDGEGNSGNGAYINISHDRGSFEDGDSVFVVDDSGNRLAWEDVWTGGPQVGPAGEYAHIDGEGSDSVLNPICTAGQHYRVIIEYEDGSSQILVDYEIPSDPTSTSSNC
ncbi:flagellin N-terminal-like domain-containing protein [Haloferax larsenii JCM 13917]|nr:type IV pilin [Haloferax larsenii]ELZ78526.1 flagellin N-terminal-like domain-containing protein [Haloferax larsenii JCM 13917]